MSEQLPILYSFRRCPYAMRARLAVAASGQAVELREVVLRDKPAAMLKASPKGTVPVLVLQDGGVIDESLDIMQWALGVCDPEGWLSQSTQEEMLALIKENDGDFKHHLDRYKYAYRYEGADSAEHRESARYFLDMLESRLSESHYLFGSAVSLADYAIMPFIRQFSGVEKGWLVEAGYTKLTEWLEGFLASDLFKAIMKKYPAWGENQPGVFFRV